MADLPRVVPAMSTQDLIALLGAGPFLPERDEQQQRVRIPVEQAQRPGLRERDRRRAQDRERRQREAIPRPPAPPPQRAARPAAPRPARPTQFPVNPDPYRPFVEPTPSEDLGAPLLPAVPVPRTVQTHEMPAGIPEDYFPQIAAWFRVPRMCIHCGETYYEGNNMGRLQCSQLVFTSVGECSAVPLKAMHAEHWRPKHERLIARHDVRGRTRNIDSLSAQALDMDRPSMRFRTCYVRADHRDAYDPEYWCEADRRVLPVRMARILRQYLVPMTAQKPHPDADEVHIARLDVQAKRAFERSVQAHEPYSQTYVKDGDVRFVCGGKIVRTVVSALPGAWTQVDTNAVFERRSLKRKANDVRGGSKRVREFGSADDSQYDIDSAPGRGPVYADELPAPVAMPPMRKLPPYML